MSIALGAFIADYVSVKTSANASENENEKRIAINDAFSNAMVLRHMYL